jgi:hypothetical protein
MWARETVRKLRADVERHGDPVEQGAHHRRSQLGTGAVHGSS